MIGLDNITLVYVNAFIPLIFSFFWLFNALYLRRNTSFAFNCFLSNFFVGMGYYFYTYRVDGNNNYFLGYYLSDLGMMIAMMFNQIGVSTFFGKKDNYKIMLLIFFLVASLQVLFRINDLHYWCILNMSAYYVAFCIIPVVYTYTHLELQNKKVKIYIVTPLSISAFLMTIRLIILIFNPQAYKVRLTDPSMLNTYVNLIVIFGLLLFNATMVGISISALLTNIEKLTNIDALTGIFNRRYFDMKMEKYKNKKYSLLILDIDFFKSINDTLGHDIGDECLKKFSNLILNLFKDDKNVLFCRLGGEEFCVLIKETTEKEIIKKYTKVIHEAVRGTVWNTPHKKLTISIGVYVNNQTEKEEIKDCIKKADLALYEAKASGRNTTIFYNKEYQSILIN